MMCRMPGHWGCPREEQFQPCNYIMNVVAHWTLRLYFFFVRWFTEMLLISIGHIEPGVSSPAAPVCGRGQPQSLSHRDTSQTMPGAWIILYFLYWILLCVAVSPGLGTCLCMDTVSLYGIDWWVCDHVHKTRHSLEKPCWSWQVSARLRQDSMQG